MQLGHTLHGVQHRGRVVDQLQIVTVAGHNQRVEFVHRAGLSSQGCQNIVGFEVLARQSSNASFVEEVANNRYLALEFLRRGFTLSFVLRKHLRAEGLAAYVEGNGNGIRFFIAQQTRHHGHESIDSISVLPAGGRELIHRQSVERAKCHGMAVNEK